MMTIREDAVGGKQTELFKVCAACEYVDKEDVHEGVIASKIAAHAADLVKGVPRAMVRDGEMARRRNNLDWKGQLELSLDPAKAARFREQGLSDKGPTCSMCGSYCAIQVFNRSQHNLEKE